MPSYSRTLVPCSALLTTLLTVSTAAAHPPFFGTMLPTYSPFSAGPPPYLYSPQFRAMMYRSVYRNPIAWGYPLIYRNYFSYPVMPAYNPSTPSYFVPNSSPLAPSYPSMNPFVARYAPPVLNSYAATSATKTYSPTLPPTPKEDRTKTITLYDNSYEPQKITISVGTTVRWINDGQHRHTVTSDKGLWDSGEMAPGSSFSRTFSEVGTYPYHCTLHPDAMKGEIVVK